MHLVIGAGEFLGGHVSRALAADVPVIELDSGADEETLADAIRSVEVVVNCAQSWTPARKLKFRRSPPPVLERIVAAARRARIRRLVHVSTVDVYGPEQKDRISEKSPVHPVHVYERLRLFEERWLLEQAEGFEVVILRPARVFGAGEDWMLPRLMAAMATGRVWLPGGGRAVQTFVSAGDVGRACLAASDRGRPGRAYLVGGFDSTWHDLLESAARAAGFVPEISTVPYELSIVRALAADAITRQGSVAWPSPYSVDLIGRSRRCDDSSARRQLTWSPSVGSFEQEMPAMAPWLAGLPRVAALLAGATREEAEVTVPPA